MQKKNCQSLKLLERTHQKNNPKKVRSISEISKVRSMYVIENTKLQRTIEKSLHTSATTLNKVVNRDLNLVTINLMYS